MPDPGGGRKVLANADLASKLLDTGGKCHNTANDLLQITDAYLLISLVGCLQRC